LNKTVLVRVLKSGQNLQYQSLYPLIIYPLISEVLLSYYFYTSSHVTAPGIEVYHPRYSGSTQVYRDYGAQEHHGDVVYA
jgi:hypothetical protein